MEDYRQEFIEIYKNNITRSGADKLLGWLEKTDFFTAPRSTKYHGACEGGLVMHSLNVYHLLKKRNDSLPEGSRYTDETIAIVALLHDFCKRNFYKISTRNVKNEITGVWEKVPYYQIEDQFPYGHGEKSVYLIERYVRLNIEEAMAIRWHMGGFDDSVKAGNFAMSDAYRRYPICVMVHLADLEATYLLEKNT